MFPSTLAIACLLACTTAESTNAASPPATPAADPAPAEDNPSAMWADVDAMLRDLPTTLSGTHDAALEELAARVRAVPGVAKATTQTGAQSSLVVELATEIDAAHAVELLAWTDAHVISGDVHQRNWHVVVRTGDVPDPYGRRIATESPKYGEWRVELDVTARPEGSLPGISAGASPAYPLASYTAKVKRISIRHDT